MEIIRTSENNLRYYLTDLNGEKLKGISCTTLIGLFNKFENKPFIKPWHLKLGKEYVEKNNIVNFSEEDLLEFGALEAKRTTTEAASFGTNNHDLIENYILGEPLSKQEWVEKYSTLSPDMYDVITKVKPFECENFPRSCGVEVPIFFKNKHDNCVGGTTDAVFDINLDDFNIYKSDEVLPSKTVTVITDYKFPKKPKYNFDLINYFLQIAIYRAGVNQNYGTNIKDGLIIVSPRSTKTVYLYYLKEEILNYYFSAFDQMLWLFSNDCCDFFDWDEFEKESKEKNMSPLRLVLK